MTQFLINKDFGTFGADPDLTPRAPAISFMEPQFDDCDVLPPWNPNTLTEFGFDTTATEVIEGINLEGKTAIVTGGYSGIGLATTFALVSAGAHVFVPAKDMKKAQKALGDVRGSITVIETDLRDVDGIQAFANAYKKQRSALDILVNNAGVIQKVDAIHLENGCGVHFWVNYVSHFALTNLLIDALANAESPRVVNVSSAGHLKEQPRRGSFMAAIPLSGLTSTY